MRSLFMYSPFALCSRVYMRLCVSGGGGGGCRARFRVEDSLMAVVFAAADVAVAGSDGTTASTRT